MIGIRVDANDKIAMGHLMRCISIATALKKMGQNVLFIMSEAYGVDFLINQGFDYISLNNDYKDKQGEVDNLVNIIKEKGIDKLLIDSYQADAEYMLKIKCSDLKLIYIDDMHFERYPVDMLVNYTIGVDENTYADMDYRGVKLLLGSEYIPLRPEFSKGTISVKDKVEKIFVTTGGTDEFGIINSLVEKLSDNTFGSLQVVVVVGKFFKDDEKLNNLVVKHNNISVYKDIKDICSVMKGCDIAVSAGGTTLAELSACGIPTVCFSIADNQLDGVRAYADKGIMFYAGDVRIDKVGVVSRVCEGVMQLICDKDIRKRRSIKAKEFVDGLGAMRIAKEIIKL